MAEYVKVAEFVRGVVDGKVVVRRPGARIPVELAVQLGVVVDAPMPEAATGPRDGSSARRPRRPQGATPPRKSRPRKRR